MLILQEPRLSSNRNERMSAVSLVNVCQMDLVVVSHNPL